MTNSFSHSLVSKMPFFPTCGYASFCVFAWVPPWWEYMSFRLPVPSSSSLFEWQSSLLEDNDDTNEAPNVTVTVKYSARRSYIMWCSYLWVSKFPLLSWKDSSHFEKYLCRLFFCHFFAGELWHRALVFTACLHHCHESEFSPKPVTDWAKTVDFQFAIWDFNSWGTERIT